MDDMIDIKEIEEYLSKLLVKPKPTIIYIISTPLGLENNWIRKYFVEREV